MSMAPLALAKAKPMNITLEDPDGYFFSRTNPIANRDQKELEAKAIELFHRADVQEAKKRTHFGYEMVSRKFVSEKTWAMFPGFLESYTFRSIQLAVNSDANYPRVMRVYNPAANWMGNDTPESRWGWENPGR